MRQDRRAVRQRQPGQRRRSLRVAVIDEHLMTVFDKVDGKSVSHMAETNDTDMSDDEFGRLLRIGGRCGYECPRWQESGKMRVGSQADSHEG